MQLHAGFDFDAAAAIADYLADLGVTHVYCSPYLQAARGSTHGYDVVDHGHINPELGGEAGLARFAAALGARGLRQVLDIVPNHMAISASENEWWRDVLENGPSSPYAAYFDIEWEPPEARLRNMVLIPVLADHYGRVLEAGEISLERRGATFRVRYAEHSFPVDPRSLGPILKRAAYAARSDALAFLADALAELPRPTATDRASLRRRHRDKAVLAAELERLLRECAGCAAAVDEELARIRADARLLHELLESQNYRLAWWRSARRDLGYRRFFDVNTLIGLRVEDAQVFANTHGRVMDLVRGGSVEGLRVDHPDGLRDPEEYLGRLRAAAPGAWIVVEKILARDERLPETWPVAGTTGYDFLNRVGRLFSDPRGEAPLTEFYRALTDEPTDFARVAHDKKLLVLREGLGSDVNRLTDLLLAICERHLRFRDYSRHDLADAIREVCAWFPVYRSYVRPCQGRVSTADRAAIERAVGAARRERPDLETPLFEFLQRLLLLEERGEQESELVARFQQLSAPAMAKGVEDTAFYTFNRFVAWNEVGGDPARFALDTEEFHAAAREIQDRWPSTLLATATHDTKRGEDVRARLAVLTECPREWIAAVRRWCGLAGGYRTRGWPDRNTEYLFYQTLVGAWPISLPRMQAYMQKAAREAKVFTSWTEPQADFEGALARFVEAALGDEKLVADVRAFVEPLVAAGRINSLAQTLLKLTAPGIPDVYQGTELWSLDLVDPDNRRPVDYAERRRALASLEGLSAREIWERADEGLPKLWTIRRALELRRRRPRALGRDGAYTPLRASGASVAHVVAFLRGDEVIAAVPRLTYATGLAELAGELALPSGEWRNVLSGERLRASIELRALWREFPVALLERELAA